MPRSDTRAPAGVTAAALARARIKECRNGAAAYRATYKVGMTAGGVVLLADIAAAAVRVAEDPYWWLTSDEYEYCCNVCDGKGLKPISVAHASDCRAMQLDAAIRAAGEA